MPYGQDWIGADLYEVIAFAVGLDTTHAALVGFKEPDAEPLPEVHVGDISVQHLDWPSDPDIAPEIAAASFSAATLAWLEATSPSECT